jgi:hypothetical protein
MFDEVVHLKKRGKWWGWTWTPKWPTTYTVGWIPAGTDLGTSAINVDDTLVDIFYDFRPMTVSLGSWYTFEKGVDQASLLLTCTFVNSSTPRYAINTVQFKRAWVDLWAPITWTDLSSPQTTTETNPIVDTTTFSVDVTDDLPETISATKTLTAVYPYFRWTVSWWTKPTADQALINSWTKVVATSTGTITINFSSANTDWIWFAIPSTSTSKTKWYVNALNNWNIGSPSDLFWDESIVSIDSPDAYWSWVNYKIYISNYTSEALLPMQLQN